MATTVAIRESAGSEAAKTVPRADVITVEGASWSTYEGLAAARGEGRRPRLAYDRGWLEIVSPTSRHDKDAYLIGVLIEFVALELRVNIVGVRSTTFSRKDIEGAFEGDNAFYVQRERQMRAIDDIDAEVHPAPDIVIEVDVSRNSKKKLGLFARFRVPEVWRVADGRILVYELVGPGYVERDRSVAIPILTAEAMARLIAAGRSTDRLSWVDEIRAWVREQTKIEST